MNWTVRFHFDFEPELAGLPSHARLDLLAHLKVLQKFGPSLGRPTVDTLKGAKHSNLKEMRFNSSGGVWRFAFAFDLQRRAVVLCGGDKSGINEERFYKDLVRRAEDRLATYLKRTEKDNAKPKPRNKKPAGRTARSRRG